MLSETTILKTKVGDFSLINREKLARVIEGTTNSKGEMQQGLGVDALTEQPDLVIALYDKVAGAIKAVKNGAKVKTGSFFDFKKKAPRETPEVVYVFKTINGPVEMQEGEEAPIEIQAEMLAAKVKEKRGAGRPKKTVNEE